VRFRKDKGFNAEGTEKGGGKAERDGGVYRRDAKEAEKGETDPSLRSEDDGLKKGHR
jgi:hypothetical protein